MPEKEKNLVSAMRTICGGNLGLSSKETLLIVADPPMMGLAGRMVQAAREGGWRSELVEVGEVEKAGCAPEGFTDELLGAGWSAALLVTSKSLSHTSQRRKACYEIGLRIASMPRLSEDMLCRLFRPGAADGVKKRTDALAARLEGAVMLRVCTRQGTELELSIEGRKIYTDTGFYREPGRFGNLPAGEVCAAPVPGTAHGRLVVDVAFAALGTGMPVEGLVIEIEKGSMVRVTGPGSERVERLLARAPDRVAGEFGIGTNRLATLCPVPLEAEKAVGTVHIGFGDNISFGGENRDATGHWDAVMRCERIEVDGRTLDLRDRISAWKQSV
ncbi:MAG: aminopeptidase [Gemmatimonadota bacterium]|nr:aminopeptidase [Gemmatimonadota bacterium]